MGAVLGRIFNRAVGGSVRIIPFVLHLDAHHPTQVPDDRNESLVPSRRSRERNRHDGGAVYKSLSLVVVLVESGRGSGPRIKFSKKFGFIGNHEY